MTDGQNVAATAGNSVTGETLARLFDVTLRRVQQLAKEGIIPKAGRSNYPLAASIRSYCIYLRECNATEGDTDPEKLKPFQRKAHYQAEKEKLALAQERGELIPRIEMEQEQGRVAKIVVQHLESIPDVLERDVGLAPPQVAKAQEIIDRCRDDIYTALIAKETPDVGGAVSASA